MYRITCLHACRGEVRCETLREDMGTCLCRPSQPGSARFTAALPLKAPRGGILMNTEQGARERASMRARVAADSDSVSSCDNNAIR